MIRKIITGWFVVFTLIAGIGYAQDNAILPINPVPGIGEEQAQLSTNAEFHGTGPIDRVAGNEIVLNDVLLRFSSDIKFYLRSGDKALISDFHVGDTAGYQLNSENEIESLWKLEGK